MEYDLYYLQCLRNGITAVKDSVCKEGYELTPEALKIIKEMRDMLQDVIVEDMYRWELQEKL